jgi:hypothetical protein
MMASVCASQIAGWIAGDIAAKSITIARVDLIAIVGFKKLGYCARGSAIEPSIIAHQKRRRIFDHDISRTDQTIPGGAQFLQALRSGAFDGCEITRKAE